jgi:hypothetical protein
MTTMPVIKIIDPGEPKQGSGQGSHLAAAMMAVALSSSHVKAAAKRPKRAKSEATRRGNPNELTRKQHVFPLKMMEQFTQNRRVSAYFIALGKARSLKPKNVLFCARRAWDQKTESGYMKRIEDEFQAIVAPIIEGKVDTIAPEQKSTVDRMYALWYARARYRDLGEQEIQLNGISGQALTKEQEENLEKNGYMFAREGGKWPARQFNGLQIQMFIDHYTPRLAAATWGVITTQLGEFIVPDVPSHTIFPLAPRLALVGFAPDGVINERNLAEINRAARRASQEYFFAHDLSNAPGCDVE